MSWILKHQKTEKIMEFEDGDVVEVLRGGKWRGGEVVSYDAGEGRKYYVSLFGLAVDVADLDDPTLRQGAHANQLAAKEYKRQIQELEDKINHKSEKDEIDELKAKIAKTAPIESKE